MSWIWLALVWAEKAVWMFWYVAVFSASICDLTYTVLPVPVAPAVSQFLTRKNGENLERVEFHFSLQLSILRR